MPRRVETEPAPEALPGPVSALLEPLEVRPHVLRAPRGVAGQVGELIPVGVMRIDEDHRVVRGAAAKGAGARIPDRVDRLAVVVLDELAIAALLFVVLVVPNEEVPADGVVFGRQRMERWNLVVFGIRVDAWVKWVGPGDTLRIAASFEHDYGVACLNQPRGNRAASRARADDDIVRSKRTRGPPMLATARPRVDPLAQTFLSRQVATAIVSRVHRAWLRRARSPAQHRAG